MSYRPATRCLAWILRHDFWGQDECVAGYFDHERRLVWVPCHGHFTGYQVHRWFDLDAQDITWPEYYNPTISRSDAT